MKKDKMKFYEERIEEKAQEILGQMELDHKGFFFNLEGIEPETQTFKFSVIRAFRNGGSKFLGYRTYNIEEERIV